MKLLFVNHFTKPGGVERFVFTPEIPLTWEPGQYMHYTLPHENMDDRGDERWFTISSAPFEHEVWITTRISPDRGSSFKRALLELQPGTTIETDAPEGDFTLDNPTTQSIFVAGGIGVTPFRSIINQLHHDGKPLNIELLYANRDADTIPFKDELEAISKEHENFHITYFIGDNHIDENALREYGAKYDNPTYYVSGPEPMVEAFEATLKEIGIPEDRVKLDFFPGYEAQ
jgi:ferredoxin-NADP reductase